MTGPAHVVGPIDVPLLADTIPAMFDRVVAAHPDRDALIAPFQDVRLSYRELAEQVDRVARGLLALGVQPGDRVGMWSPNNVEWVYIQFATASVGAILVNLNPAYRTDELVYAVAQSGCRVLISARQFKTSDYTAMVAEARDATARRRTRRVPRHPRLGRHARRRRTASGQQSWPSATT